MSQEFDDIDPHEQPAPSGRDPLTGRFAPGNLAGMRHGGRSSQLKCGLLPDASRAREAMTQMVECIIKDIGGEATVSAVKRDLTTRFVEVSTIADHLGRNLAENGVLTTKGRRRAALTCYLATVDRLVRLAGLIGLERDARPVTSLANYLISHHQTDQHVGSKSGAHSPEEA